MCMHVCVCTHVHVIRIRCLNDAAKQIFMCTTTTNYLVDWPIHQLESIGLQSE